MLAKSVVLSVLTFVALSLSGCVIHERAYVAAPPCPGAVLVAGHYGPYGHWHRAHWVCPAPRAVVVVR
jgi:hypothetical protein